ncbi:MAG: hypothetical protein HYS41_04575 [Candidatus Omnitrophica bacterium]|nr:hypothetical protein [Candidatus Omnitrophota bacterium]
MSRRRRLAGCLLLSSLFLLAFSTAAFAQRPALRLSHGARWSLRSKPAAGSEVLGRLELAWKETARWFLVPFAEVRRDVDQGSWSRTELGAEAGFKLFSWFTVSQGLHRAWLSGSGDRFEWEIRTLLSWPAAFLPKVGTRPVMVYALNEYTYNLESGQGLRNEVAVGFKIPLPSRRWAMVLGWRHMDLIHGLDMDQFESSFEIQF